MCKWLFEVGAAADITKATNDGATPDISGEQEELEAAFLVARRKRLGPYREKKEREANRNRDLGVLSQAGYEISKSLTIFILSVINKHLGCF